MKEWSTWILALLALVPMIQTIVSQINASPGMELLVTNPVWQIFTMCIAILGIVLKNIPQKSSPVEVEVGSTEVEETSPEDVG